MSNAISTNNQFSAIANQQITSNNQAIKLLKTVGDFEGIKSEVVEKAVDYLLEGWKEAHVAYIETAQSPESLYIELAKLDKKAYDKLTGAWVQQPDGEVIKFSQLFKSRQNVLLNIKEWVVRPSALEVYGKEKLIGFLKSMVSGLKKPKKEKSDIEKLATLQKQIETAVAKTVALNDSHQAKEALKSFLNNLVKNI